IKKATLKFSAKGSTALLVDYIPELDKLDFKLRKTKIDRTLAPVLRFGAWKGLEVLNRYYGKVCRDSRHKVAMAVLHPFHKLEYFRQQEWLVVWVKDVEANLKDEYLAGFA
ncbi:hypothetical protein BT69DRAFT_1189690, partial [Atractiella rhizophila]